MHNSFGELQVPGSVVDCEGDHEATHDDVSSKCVKKSVCQACGKHVLGDVTTCARCKNHSFVHISADALNEHNVDVLGDAAHTGGDSGVEVVPLNVFTRAGKRGHYDLCGVLALK